MPTYARSARLPSVKPTPSRLSFLQSADLLASQSVNLSRHSAGEFQLNDRAYEIPKYLHLGQSGGDEPLRIGLFAGIHGDEPEGSHALIQFLHLLEAQPDLAQGYCLSVYPVVNPTGFEDGTRHARHGRDLNREFWASSQPAEVRLLEREIRSSQFHGIITLHSDNTSDGLYGFVRGATLSRHLIEPALAAAESVLPRNSNLLIDGFAARHGVIRDCYDGVLSAPPEARPGPFEIILETPQSAPQYLQQQAFVLALGSILAEYRKLIAYAANL